MAYDEIFRNSVMAYLKSVENTDGNNLMSILPWVLQWSLNKA